MVNKKTKTTFILQALEENTRDLQTAELNWANDYWDQLRAYQSLQHGRKILPHPTSSFTLR